MVFIILTNIRKFTECTCNVRGFVVKYYYLMICARLLSKSFSADRQRNFSEVFYTMDIVLGIILLIAAVFLIVSVLMQNGKSHELSGAIVGGAETFFGKNKGATVDKVLSKVTSVVAIVFCLIVVAMYIFQEDVDYSNIISNPSTKTTVSDGSDTADTTVADGETTAADAETTVEETTAAE